jgi:putative hydrolase of the HAD superfamily
MLSIDRIQLITFDLDDTLYPEIQYVAAGFRNLADFLAKGDQGLSDLFYEKMTAWHLQGRRDIFQQILAEIGQDVSERAIHDLIDIYRTSDRQLTLFPDADRAIDRFRAAGTYLAILTDGWLDPQQKKIHWLNLHKRMDAIFYTDALGKDFWKPSPRGFEQLMRHFNLPPGECIYIADNELKDFAGPNRLGWRTVKIVRQNGLYRDKTTGQEDYKPNFIIQTLDELIINK